MMWFDAHLDLAYLAVCGRDMTAPLDPGAGPHAPAAVTLPSLAEGGVRLAMATIFTEPDGSGPEGYPAGDFELAARRGRAQMEVYQTWRDAGLIALDLRECLRRDPGTGEIRGGMGVAELVPPSIDRVLARSDRGPRGMAGRDDGRSIKELRLSVRAQSCLEERGIHSIGQLVQRTAEDLLQVRAFGRASLREVQQALKSIGLALWTPPLHIGILIENADPIRSPDELIWWRDRGVIAIGLAWAKSSRYAGGNSTQDGLSPLGRELVTEIDRLGIVHDASHLSDRAFAELCEATARPIIASHSNCRALLGDPGAQRHLTDDQIREIARRGVGGGVVGLNLFSKFIVPGVSALRAGISAAIDHVEHVCELTGSRRHVGLGSDMDGGFPATRMPEGIDHPRDLTRLGDELSRRGWSDDDVFGFACGNWIRFWSSQRSSRTTRATDPLG